MHQLFSELHFWSAAIIAERGKVSTVGEQSRPTKWLVAVTSAFSGADRAMSNPTYHNATSVPRLSLHGCVEGYLAVCSAYACLPDAGITRFFILNA